MANAPFNIFSQHCKPDEVMDALKKLLPEISIKTDDAGVWTSARGTWKRGWLKSALTMTVNHDPAYYGGTGWVTQLSGMAGYFNRFPDAKRRPDLFGYLPGLRFALSFILEPVAVDSDPRQEVIFQIARLVDGVIFLPTCLLDSQGRAIVAADGDSDPDAQLPEHDSAATHEAGIGIDAELKHDPPTQERVVSRLLFMSELVNRGLIENEPGGEEARQEMLENLRGSDAWATGDADEIAALETPVGRLSDKVAWQLPWLAEGATVLAWALELGSLPSYDEQVNHDTFFQIVSALESGEVQPALRARSDLDQLAFQMLAIHWRLRQFHVKQEPMNFEEYAPKAWCGAMDLSLAKLIDHDLAVNGQTLGKAPEAAWKCAAGIMEERRKALHWVLGHHPVYSQNDTST